MVVLKNFLPELLYILVAPFSICLRELFSRMVEGLIGVSVFKIVGKILCREISTSKNYNPGSLLSMISSVFKELVNNRFVDHLKNEAFFLRSVWF